MASAPAFASARRTFDVLGVRVDAVEMGSAIARIERWIAIRDRTRYVTFTNVHAVMEARSNESFARVLHEADMVCPDGKPIAWMGKLRAGAVAQVCGPELLVAFLQHTAGRSYSHFFYGGAEGVPQKLVFRLQQRFPEMKVAGCYSPPFRALTAGERAEVVRNINAAAPDLLWVGLGCPKQERWMYEQRRQLNVSVMLGVGQAFDIHAGTSRQAPRWVRRCGLEWLFRLAMEPRRLWRRYLVYNTGFVVGLAAELLGRD